MNSLVTIGNFDGVHRGHQALLQSAARLAAERGERPVLLTFDPHPALVLGRAPPPLLTQLERKRELAERTVPELEFVAHPFDLAFASKTPREFCSFLRDRFSATSVIVGENFRFGKGRAGDFAALEALGQELGFDARKAELASDEVGVFSSSRVRALLAEGDVGAASAVLGRPHAVAGVVAPGKRLGRTLGFPTANLAEVREVLPRPGIYAVLVDLVEPGGARALAKGAMSIGTNPTTDGQEAEPSGAGDQPLKAEVFLLDFEGDLYGKRLRVGFVRRLRSEQRFDSLDALVVQMNHDVTASRALLADAAPLPPPPGAAGGSYL